ncbi:Uncharacterised protein [Mycobacteroides abscessus subsp. abscessus]|uniref:hypothetical protein n=1 Tax=Mycobacteroides abscessus TaxID=36809 RepID=UPI000928F4AE|nr:hypothetical protein [Mycobacteroides abscessus]SIK10569.1 Uncharacterised protein [Mycobacteroides abscessus subsp. abscessus]SKF60095.1 Uncharacterised protein [Mycobacteroides abscessus subsp. abscessus]
MKAVARRKAGYRQTVSLALVLSLAATCPGCTVYESLTHTAGSDPSAAGFDDNEDRQIRIVVTKMEQALNDFDLSAASELTCTRAQVASRSADISIMPTMNSWKGIQAASVFKDSATLTNEIASHFPAASAQQKAEILRAIVNRDHSAYQTTGFQILRQSLHVTAFTVDKITVVGDEATGQITATLQIMGAPPQIVTKTNHFQRDRTYPSSGGAGRWQYCQKAPPGILSQWIRLDTSG